MLVATVRLDTPTWVAITIMVFIGVTLAMYLVAYVYCLINDKEALRSETYSIQKLAIEKGFVGDNLAGVIALEDEKSGRILPMAETAREEEQLK